jgi:hypothetical protein
MTPWAKGLFAGLTAGLLVALLVGSTSFDAFVRVTGDGQYLLDAREDESVLGRIVNLPVASLGEVSLQKRVWVVASIYVFTLRVRPELARGPERMLRGLLVNVRLPGRVLTTNATRVQAGTATWEGLPSEALQLRTVAVHWVPLGILMAVLAVGLGLRRSWSRWA